MTVDLASIFPVSQFKKWSFRRQFWPRDIAIRRNLLTSMWQDPVEMVACRDASIHYADGTAVPEDVFLSYIEDIPEDGPSSASIRWGIVIGEDDSLHLQLQALPESVVFLRGKAAYKG
jgi:hypothetical protein